MIRTRRTGVAGPALVAATLLASSVFAAQTRSDEATFFDEPPVVLSLSRMPQPLAEAPGAVTVIDREMIRASGARTIPDILRLVPGYNVGFRNGHSAAVSYHGYTDDYPRRMQVMIDGRSVYTPFFVGGVDWASWPIALDDIESIEVVRGTNAVAYGSNAFMGAVNIITRTALESQGFRLSASQGDKGIQDRTARIGVKGESIAARVTWGLRKDNGLDAAYDSSRTEFVNGRVDWQIGRSTDLSFWGAGSVGRRGDGYAFFVDPPGVPNVYYPPHFREQDSAFAQVRLRHAFSPDNELIVQYYQNRETGRDRWTAEFLPGFPQAKNADRIATRDNFEVQNVVRPFPALRVSWGGEWRRDTLQSAYTLGTDDRQSVFLNRLYANGEWRAMPTVIVNAGVMREDYTISGVTVSPRAFVNWLPVREHAFRIGMSEGYRTPTIFEERANWVNTVQGLPIPLDQFYRASGGLRAEKIYSREIGYVGEWRAIRGTFDLRVFDERVKQWICRYVRPLPPGSELASEQETYDFANCGGRPRFAGVEAFLKMRPFTGTLVVAGYSYAKPRSFYTSPEGTTVTSTSAGPGYQTFPVIFPSTQAQFMLKQSLPWQVDVSVAWYRVMGFRLSATQLAGTFVDASDPRPYDRVDVKVAKRFAIGSTRNEIAVTGQNIGRGTDDFYYGQQFTRRWFLSLATEL